MDKFWQAELAVPPCVLCVVCGALVRCVLLVCNVWVLAFVLTCVLVLLLVLVCHADPSSPIPLPPPPSTHAGVYVQNAPSHPRVYIQSFPVCTGTTPASVTTCGRGAGTHGEVLNIHTGFSACHTTPHAHTATTTTYTT